MEYLILLYSSGTATTIIGIADAGTAYAAFEEACRKYDADWAYLYQGDGAVLDRYQRVSALR